eukprot:5109773-Prymnesium_polylepis.1
MAGLAFRRKDPRESRPRPVAARRLSLAHKRLRRGSAEELLLDLVERLGKRSLGRLRVAASSQPGHAAVHEQRQQAAPLSGSDRLELLACGARHFVELGLPRGACERVELERERARLCQRDCAADRAAPAGRQVDVAVGKATASAPPPGGPRAAQKRPG